MTRTHRLDTRRDSRMLAREDVIAWQGTHFAPCRQAEDDGEFYLIHADGWPYKGQTVYSIQLGAASGVVFTPPHPSMTPEDIMGATYAWDDGTYWHFAHCSPDEHTDFAADAELYTRDQMQDYILRDTFDALEASDLATKTAALYKAKALKKFAIACGRWAHKHVVSQTLGHFHRDPHHDHRREIAVAALDAVLADWKAKGKTDNQIDLAYRRVKDDAATARTRLTSTHEYEWRAERKARLEREAAARGDDPVGGHEYCYVLSQTAEAITGESNLPDPAWAFDRLRTGTIGRGLFVYSDAEPATNRLLSWVIRFKRPIPAGTKSGADIGSVAWEQEPAYQP